MSKNMKFRIPQILSLSMLKMEKNFIAQEKGYMRQPYKELSLEFLFKRLDDEIKELKEAKTHLDIMEECADVSNLIDYIYEKILRDRCIDE